MCTAIYYADRFLGRNLDLGYRYRESVCITPGGYPLRYRYYGTDSNHYRVIGMATVANGYPLYYDGMNEHGLGICALNFKGYCKYTKPDAKKLCLASFELIPYLLTKMKSVAEIKEKAASISLTDEAFSNDFPTPELHYIAADGNECIALEPREDGIRIYENPIGVLTNNPPFDYHKENLRCYLNLTADEVNDRFSNGLDMKPFSSATGAMGLPGDGSSASRFVRTAFNLRNADRMEKKSEAINQAFHILSSAEAIRGTVKEREGTYMTQYSSVMDLKTGTYYYKTYCRSIITSISFKKTKSGTNELIRLPLRTSEEFFEEALP